MRNFKLILIALATLALFAACAKEETASSTTTAEPTSVQREPEVAPPPAADESVPAETTTDPVEAPATDTATEAAPDNPPAAPTQSAAAPAPMLPRRGETAPPAAASAPAPENDPAISQRITIRDAYEVVRAGNGVLLDVRTTDAHQYQRIPGSLHIPLDQVANRAKELPQDKWIITYCTCPAEESSGAAATTLKNMGFERVAALLGGMQGWRGQGLPVEFGR